ncbi:MAG TPA: protein kinase, partial [Kofleriaceae bacterium]
MTDDDTAPPATESAVDPSGSTAASTVRGAEQGPPRGLGPGDCVGRYTVRSLIGAGGMGQVFAATDNELGRTVALKVIRPDRGASSYARARLQREAQALALLRHPNVVTVHDVGTQGDNVFLAMELVEGPTLGDWLRGEPRSWRAIRDVFLAAGRGLAAAHAAGIVHRDFKPD